MQQVSELLGPPSGTVRKALLGSSMFTKSRCLSDNVDQALFYYRVPEESFVIYLDATGHVACKEMRLLVFAADHI